MVLNRREWIAACSGAALAMGASPREKPNHNLGLVIHSYAIRGSADRAKPAAERIDDAFVFLEHAHRLGADGVQVGIGERTDAEAERLRAKAAELQMYLEGTVSLPGVDSDLTRFDAQVASAKRAGAAVLRGVLLSGRRYETFRDLNDFR